MSLCCKGMHNLLCGHLNDLGLGIYAIIMLFVSIRLEIGLHT